MKPTLHIVNGAGVSGNLRDTGIDDIAYWHEALYQGPLVVADDIAFTAARQPYWEAQHLGPSEWILTSTTSRLALPHTTALIAELGNYSSVILWFEFDLYDQSMLWYILRQYKEHPNLPPPSLITTDAVPGVEYFRGFGVLKPEQLQQLIGTEKIVTTEEIAAASEAWEAYASGDSEKIEAFMQKPQILPYANRALRAYLAQCPMTPTMLGGIQMMLLERISTLGSPRVLRVIGETMGNYNPDYGLSDRAAVEYLVSLSEDPRKLIEFTEGSEVVTWKSLEITTVLHPLVERGICIRATKAGKALLAIQP